jgi:hypothetical protein
VAAIGNLANNHDSLGKGRETGYMEPKAITNVFWHRALAEEYESAADRTDEIFSAPGFDDFKSYELYLSYQTFIHETHNQFKVMESRGIDVIFTDIDPYETPEDLFRDIDVKVLRVFTGGELPYGHPMTQQVKVFTGPKMPLPISTSINNVFRAVHDYYGHYGDDSRGRYPFGTTAAGLGGNGLIGEEYAYQRHKRQYSPDAWMALTVETRCQTAANNLLPRVIETGGFIEQKAVWLPEWAYKV